MSQTSTRASRKHQTSEPMDVRNADDPKQPRLAEPADRSATPTTVGWRYGSALAAARALNARPVRA
ncbi:MAG TPA: hypothetical protein VHO29_11645 [Marmoricola sp.]|nr:hypothetical protein [Marmoricola sp.]